MGTATATPAQALQAVLRGYVERPLVVPLASAAAGELQGLEPRAVLADPGKLGTLVKELATSLRADAAVAEFGTFWDAEALGMSLDWSRGFPPVPRGRITAAQPDFERSPRAAVVLDVLRRLGVLLDGPLLAAGITGPVTLSRLSGGDPPPEAVAARSLAAARALCEAGARIIWVVEQPAAPASPEALVRALAPLWGSIRFYQSLGVLHLAGSADGWRPVLEGGGPYLPCFDPDAAPEVAALVAEDERRPFGLALPPGPPSPRARELAAGGRCALVTHAHELAGIVPPRELAACASQLAEVLR
jgi:hypothetical protein